MRKLCLLIISLVVGFSASASAGPTFQVIISEIFADPTPTRGLPEKEFIELYNNTSEPINLEGFILNYNTSEVEFPSFLLKPDAYLIVCRRGNGEFLEPYGNVLELSKFSLLNRGTTLTLSDPKGNVSHSVSYSDDWYSSERDQGYSLEMIDLSFPCSGKSNWTSTTSEVGGTPGLQNSVYASNPDLGGPILLSKKVDADSIFLQFSETLDTDLKGISLEITEGIGIDDVAFVNNGTALQLVLEEPLFPERIYSLLISGLSDCSGNVFDGSEISLGNLPQPIFGDLKLTEVLFNPFPDGEDFIEVQNVSGKVLNLRALQAWNLDNDNLPDDISTLFASDFLLPADSVLCFTENKSQLESVYGNLFAKNIIEVTSLPSMTNSQGKVYLGSSFQSVLIDSMSYNEDDHSSFIDDVEGVSLTRNLEKWVSTSGALGYATPGWIPKSLEANKSYVSISPEVITPNGDALDDELTILINTAPETVTITVYVYNRYGNEIAQVVNNLYLGSGGEVRWQPVSNQLQTGYYYVMVSLNFSQKVITEKIPFVIASHY